MTDKNSTNRWWEADLCRSSTVSVHLIFCTLTTSTKEDIAYVFINVCLFDCLFVCSLSGLRKNYSTNLKKNSAGKLPCGPTKKRLCSSCNPGHVTLGLRVIVTVRWSLEETWPSAILMVGFTRRLTVTFLRNPNQVCTVLSAILSLFSFTISHHHHHLRLLISWHAQRIYSGEYTAQ